MNNELKYIRGKEKKKEKREELKEAIHETYIVSLKREFLYYVWIAMSITSRDVNMTTTGPNCFMLPSDFFVRVTIPKIAPPSGNTCIITTLR